MTISLEIFNYIVNFVKLLIGNILYGIEQKRVYCWIKRLTFFLIFICLSICTEKYEQSFSPEQEKPLSQQTESKPLPDDPEIPDIPEIPQKPIRQKKPESVTTPSPVEKLALEIVPIERGQIDLISVPTEISEMIDVKEIYAQMEQLAAGSFSDSYKVYRFYIPPVEYKLNPKDLIVPASLITIGALASHSEKFKDILPVNRPNPRDRETPVDNVAQFVAAPSLFVFDALGKEKHHPVDQFFITAISYGITVLPVRFIKNHYDSPRPYGGNNSFPSGHTAVAFVGSHMIYKEFKDSNPWIAYSGYAMGVFVAGGRVANDKHWVSDVMAGAGIAILATELAYWIYFPVRNLITDKANDLFGKYIILSPVIQSNTLGLNFSMTF
jgi:hypothetical protein